MRISFSTNRNVRWEFDFGWETPMWSSMYWFTLTKVLFDTEQPDFLRYESVCMWFKHPNYWAKSTLKLVLGTLFTALTFGYATLVLYLLSHYVWGYYILIGSLVAAMGVVSYLEYKKR
jgi:hypothetical protein